MQANKLYSRIKSLVMCFVLTIILAVQPSAQVIAAPIKVLSYNIHHGEGTDLRFDLPGIAKLIKDTAADIVGLQEVDQRTSRSKFVDQGAEIAKLLGFNYVFTPHFPYQGGNYGLALLSRYPIVAHKSHPLPTAPGVEAKSMLQATVKVEDALIDVFVIHFEVRNTVVRQAQADAAAAIIARSPNPSLLMGDFNALPDTELMYPFRYIMQDTHIAARFLAPAKHMQSEPILQRTYTGGGATYPADAPKNRADLIWATPALRPAAAMPVQSISSKRSDHTAVVATLELVAPMQPALALPTTWKATTEAVVLISERNAAWFEATGVNPGDYGQALVDWLTQAGLQGKVIADVTEVPPGALVLLPGGRYLSDTEAAALKAHVTAGGGLMAWADAGVESGIEPDTTSGQPIAQPLAELLGVRYMGWVLGFPTRGQVSVRPEIAQAIGLPQATRFWRMEGVVVQLAPGAQALGYWMDNRGQKPSHPEQINTAIAQNGRTVYVGFNLMQLIDKDNPDVKALFTALVRYLAVENAASEASMTQAASGSAPQTLAPNTELASASMK